MLEQYRFLRLVPLLVVLLLMVLLSAHPALSQVGQDALEACHEIGFSTEEDFVTQGPEPADGNPIISDGDLLSADGSVCARNADLLTVFQPTADLGLDAVDVINVDNYLVAFSTELDDPGGQFTAGDLLTTGGAVIPNVALVAAFDVSYDIGLDTLHFVGDSASIEAFLEAAKDMSRDSWLSPEVVLADMLREYGIDLWFSTEGTPPPVKQPAFLDGDLLSALGTIVAKNDALLPASVPAGLPNRGVDFGLDAFTTLIRDTETASQRGYFSTELLYNDPTGALSFSDGDVLYVGDGIAITNWSLIAPLEPWARDLGLDALTYAEEVPVCEKVVEITEVGGVQVDLIDPATGYARKSDGASPPSPPPASAPFDRPFGQWVSIRGNLPNSDCVDVTQYEYRVEFQETGGAWTPITTVGLATPGDPTDDWRARLSPVLGFCHPFSAWQPYQSDSDGWISLSDYWRAKVCEPSQALNVWNTAGKDRSFQLRLTLRQIGTPGTEVMSAAVPVFLDNTAPAPLEMTLYDATGAITLTNQCEVSATDPVTVTIKGQVRDNGQGAAADGDEHFRVYDLYWTGGDVHGWRTVPLAAGESAGYRYYDGGRPDLDGTGTLPAAAINVPLGKLNLTAEHIAATGHPPIACGYTIWLRAWDRTIRGDFTDPGSNDISDFYRFGWRTNFTRSFCFKPPGQ